MPKRKYLLLVFTIIGLGLSACTRSAAPAGQPTATLDDIASVYYMRGTLTAQASSGGTQPATSESGSSPLFASTPTSTSSLVTPTPTQLYTPAPTSPQSVPNTYTLHDGEYPYCIARRFDVDILALLSSSGLEEADLYEIGTVLTIPASAAPFQGERTLLPHPTQYTVLSGETFYSISCKFGDVFPESIAQANAMDVDADLTTGQVIQIP
jgi:LysM repeat protein